MIIQNGGEGMLFADRLRELRTQRNLTQFELASKLDVNKQTISQYERGVRRPDLESLSALCDYFNVSTDYMLGKSDVTLRFLTSDQLSLVDGVGLKNSTPAALPADEEELLSFYRKLNKHGKEKVRGFVSDMLEIDKYTSLEESSISDAG